MIKRCSEKWIGGDFPSKGKDFVVELGGKSGTDVDGESYLIQDFYVVLLQNRQYYSGWCYSEFTI